MSKQNYILDNINELSIQDRREIVHKIYNSASRSKLKEKGGGMQIKMSDLTVDLIDEITEFIQKKMESN